jgi:hypothetical protein
MDEHGVEVNTEAWPLVVVRFGDRLDDAAITCLLEGMDRVVDRKAKFSALLDTRKIRSFPDAKGRVRLGEYMKERTFAEAAYNCGNAIVLSSTIARGILTAMHWIRPPVTEHGFFARFDEGLAWCCERLSAANVNYSPSSVVKWRETAGRPQD